MVHNVGKVPVRVAWVDLAWESPIPLAPNQIRSLHEPERTEATGCFEMKPWHEVKSLGPQSFSGELHVGERVLFILPPELYAAFPGLVEKHRGRFCIRGYSRRLELFVLRDEHLRRFLEILAQHPRPRRP
jgi:hypothetical protein